MRKKDERVEIMARLLDLADDCADLTADLLDVASCVSRWPEEKAVKAKVLPFRRDIIDRKAREAAA